MTDTIDKIDLSKMAIEILQESTNEKRVVDQVLNNNYVFITSDDKEPLMIKFVSKEERNRIEVETAMFNFLNRKTDLIVPKVLDFGENKFGVYILREMIKGETLEKYLKNNPNEIEELYYEAGIILAKLHSIEFSEKGFFKPDLSICKCDLFTVKEYIGFIEILSRKGVISNKEYINLKKIDVEYYFSNKKNVLCHCDYNPKNILVRDRKIAGVIDYEWVSAAPFMDDLATFDLFAELYDYDDNIKCFYEGYKTIKPIDEFYFEGIEFYKFYRLLTMLSYQSEASDDRFQGEFQQKMKEKLKEKILCANGFRKV